MDVSKQCQRKSSGAPPVVGPFSVVSQEDDASLTLGRRLASGEAKSQGFTAEETAKARASKLGDGWEAWSEPGSPKWFVRRLLRNAYDPSKAHATYTVLGPAEEVMARFVTADAVPALMRRAKGDASVLDDRDGTLVIAGTDGADATLDMVEERLGDYEAEHVVAPDVVGYFTDSGNPGRALTLGQLDYDPAKNYLDPRDARAIEALAPGESHQPRPADPDEGPVWGVVTRLSAVTQAKALVRASVVLGVGLDEGEARADATERCPTDAEAADVEVVDATLAAVSGWHDDELRDRVCLAPDGTVRRIDVYDVLPHDQGTPNDPGWASDEWDEPGDAAPPPVAPEPAAATGARHTVHNAEGLLNAIARVEGPGWTDWFERSGLADPCSFHGAIEQWRRGLGAVINGIGGLHRYMIRADGEVVYSEMHGWGAVEKARAEGFRIGPAPRHSAPHEAGSEHTASDPAKPAAAEPTYWLLQTIDGKDTRERVGDLDAGRAAWLAAVNGGRATYAALTGPGSGRLDTWPCEWSTEARTFHDRTDAYRVEMAALAARLTAEAPEGYSVTLRDQPHGWRVVFTGSRFGEHTLQGSASTAERVQSHWWGYTNRSEGV